MPDNPPTPREIERFFAKTEESGGCTLWTGGTDGTGYGHFWFRGHVVSAHRWVWETINGPIPPNAVLHHHCHNRRCVNIEHLQLVTQQENLQDKVPRDPLARLKALERRVELLDGNIGGNGHKPLKNLRTKPADKTLGQTLGQTLGETLG